MNKNGPIIILEADDNVSRMLTEVFKNLKYPNTLHFFPDGLKALEFLNASDVIPFMILSDMNLPKLDGFALRDKIKMDAKLQLRCIPYLFFSTALNQDDVIKAYSLSAQGVVQKQLSVENLEKTVTVIMNYWARCASPNNFL